MAEIFQKELLNISKSEIHQEDPIQLTVDNDDMETIPPDV